MQAKQPEAGPEPAALAPADERRVDELNDQAWNLRHKDAGGALEKSQVAHTLSTFLAYPKGVAYSLLAKAFAQFRLARLQDARTDAEASRKLLETQNDKPGLVRALNTLGIIYGETGELLAALRAFLDADVLCKELGDYGGEADALNNSGSVYTYLGDYVNALDYYQQSLRVCEEQGHPTAKERALLNIGVTYFELGQYNEALNYFSLVSVSAERNPQLYALSLLNSGRAQQQLGNIGAARDAIETSLALSRTLGNALETSYALDTRAELELVSENWPAALAALQESLSLKEAAGDVRGQSETLLLLATVAEKQGNRDAATTQLQRALEITEQVGNPRERYRAYRHLADIYERQGRYQEALACYRCYNELHEGVSRGAVGQQMQGLRLRFEVSQSAREREIYRLKNAELQELNDALRAADTEKSQLLVKLERQAEEDALTGLYNRRHFDERFARSFAEAKRLKTPLSAVILDIDNFKGINDRFSHGVGDTVLKIVAALMKESVRAIDTVARYGGEEFVILLPGASLERAVKICERFRATVETHPWERVHPELRVTLSLGVSADLGVENHERMLACADAKLYEAKGSGKNRVCI